MSRSFGPTEYTEPSACTLDRTAQALLAFQQAAPDAWD